MGKFRNMIKLPTIYFGIIKSLNKQRKFLKEHINPLLNKLKDENDGTLSDKDFLKINKYYGLAVPSILGEAFCVLRGTVMTNAERWASTSQGIITGIFDDFFDDRKLSEEYIVQMVKAPSSIKPKTSNELLFINFYLIALKKAAHPDLIVKQFLKVYNSQVESVEQEKSDIHNNRIWEITCHKGGDSVLFYREGFDHPMVAGEMEALYRLGTLMQFENDIFDVFKDYSSNIKTIPTASRKVSDIRRMYNHEMNLFISLCFKINYPKEYIIRFLDKVMPVINRGFVCLDQYQKLEDCNEGQFKVDSFTRKQLICDMEKPGNILRTIYYQIKNRY